MPFARFGADGGGRPSLKLSSKNGRPFLVTDELVDGKGEVGIDLLAADDRPGLRRAMVDVGRTSVPGDERIVVFLHRTGRVLPAAITGASLVPVT